MSFSLFYFVFGYLVTFIHSASSQASSQASAHGAHASVHAAPLLNKWQLHGQVKTSRLQKRNEPKLIPVPIPNIRRGLIIRDPNCFYRAISYLLDGRQDDHKQLKKTVLTHLRRHSRANAKLNSGSSKMVTWADQNKGLRFLKKHASRKSRFQILSRLKPYTESEVIQATADVIGRDIIIHNGKKKSFKKFKASKESLESPLELFFEEKYPHYQVIFSQPKDTIQSAVSDDKEDLNTVDGSQSTTSNDSHPQHYDLLLPESNVLRTLKRPPAESKALPVESNDLPLESNDLLAKSNDLLAETNDLLAESNDLLAKSNNLLAESNDLPAESNDLTLQDGDDQNRSFRFNKFSKVSILLFTILALLLDAEFGSTLDYYSHK